MKKSLIALGLMVGLTAGAVRAAAVEPEEIPAEFIQQFAPIATLLYQQQFPNPPVKVDPNAEKALGYHVKQEVAALAIPDKALSEAVLNEAKDKDVPVGVITAKSLSLIAKDKDETLPNEKLAVLDIQGQIKLALFFLAVQSEGDNKVLRIYGKDAKEPIATVPLKKMAGDAAKPIALKLTNVDTDKKRADMTLSLGGAYEGTVKLGFAEF
jgi:hypothetical protein